MKVSAGIMQICQLRADTSEKERDFRTKQQNQLKAHVEQVEQLKVSYITKWSKL